MAVATMRVPTIFTAVDRFSDVVSKMTSKTAHFSKSTVGAINRVDHKLNNMWGSMNSISQLAIGGGVGGLFYYAGQDVMNYESAIASLSAVTGTKIGAMNGQIESLAKTSKISAIEVAKSFEIVGSKMSEYLDNPEALKKITEAGVILSRASRMPLEESINNLTQSLNIYKAEAKDALHFVNKLSAGETVGSISIGQSTDILRQFGAQAVSTNVKLEESVALIQTLTKPLGVEGVGRGLRNILFDISAPATWDKRKLAGIKMAGINTKILTDETLSFRDRLKELEKFKGNNDAIGLFFKRTGTVVAKSLLQNIDIYDNFIGKINSLNDAESKAAKNTSTLSAKIDMMKASFTNFVVTGDNATGVLKIVKGLIGWLTDNMGSLVNLILSVTVAFLAWKSIVTVIALINGVMGAFNAIMAVHRFVVLWATMTNVGYATSLWAVAAATLAAYWPLLLIAGALGVLVYSIWDTKSATDTMVSGQISALEKGNVAWKNSTSVISNEVKKQAMLLNAPNAKAIIKDRNINMLNSFNLTKEKVKSAELQNLKLPKIQQLSKDAIRYQVRTGFYKFEDKSFAKYNQKETPENLAGPNDNMQTIKDFMKEKTGKLELNISATSGYDVELKGTPPQGINVVTKQNQGYRGKEK